MEKEFEAEVTIDGICYLCEVTLELTPGDDGIGAYEYWGAKGNDSQPCWELESLTFEACDEQGQVLSDPARLAKIEDALTDKAWAIIQDMDLPSRGDC